MLFFAVSIGFFAFLFFVEGLFGTTFLGELNLDVGFFSFPLLAFEGSTFFEDLELDLAFLAGLCDLAGLDNSEDLARFLGPDSI